MPELTRKIIRATNRQTEVKDEAFEALNPFHTELEEFFLSMRDHHGVDLYYERRSKQYASDDDVKQHQIVSLSGILKSYVAMYCDEPHSTHRYYGEILKAYRTRVFRDNHSCYPYFISALCFRRVDRALLRGVLPRWARDFKFHFLMMFRIYAEVTYGLSARKDPECRALVTRILNDKQFDADLAYLMYLCENRLTGSSYSRQQAARRKAITDELKACIADAHSR